MNYSILINIFFAFYAFFTFFKNENILKLTFFNYTLNAITTLLPNLYNTLIINIIGVKIYTSDLYNLVLLVLLISKSGKLINIRNKELFITLFSCLALVSLALGIYKFGKTSTLVSDIRKFGNLLVPIIYFAKFPIKFDEKNCRFLTWAMRGVLVYCYISWFFALAFNVYISPEHSLRSLTSNYALVLCFYTLYLVYHDIVISKENKLKAETLLFIMALVILQHNSVYTAFGLGVLIIILFNFRKTVLTNPKWIVQLLIGGGVIFAIIALFPNVRIVQTIITTFDKFSDATSVAEGTEIGTIGTRYLIWRRVISTLKSPRDWLIGKPMGTGYFVKWNNGIWQNSPHSGYIETIMRTGIIGAFFLFSQILINIINHIKRKEYLMAALLVSILAYWYPYSYTTEAGFLIGMSIALLCNNTDFSLLLKEKKNNGIKIIYK